MTYETLTVDIADRVALLRLNRPEALNALNAQMLADLTAALAALEHDPNVAVLAVTGSPRAFAAGADVKELSAEAVPRAFVGDSLSGWEVLARFRKPTIAAVSGFALGGGCELAMMCDIIYAAENAKFGQPEIRLGIIPGYGGSQRLARAVGKAKAADLCLTGRMMDAAEAERSGLVARVFPADVLLEETLAAARAMAAFSIPALVAMKAALAASQEAPLSAGLAQERVLFQNLFGTEDQKEGMAAFVEKRAPVFKDR